MEQTLEQVREGLGEWIDTDVLAEQIVEHLVDEGLEVTLELAKKCWLDFLESELHDSLRRSAQALA